MFSRDWYEIPDTTVLIGVIRDRAAWQAFRAALSSGRIWISAVVLAELYAGTRSMEEARLLDSFVALSARLGRLVVPSAVDWIRAGRLIARRTRLQGHLRPRDHLTDVLIVLSAAGLAGIVITSNVRHLQAWADLANAAGLDVTVTAYRS